MLRGDNFWLVQDGRGAMWELDVDPLVLKKVVDFHADAITRVEPAPSGHQLVSCGADGTVRMWDARSSQSSLAIGRFNSAATSLEWVPSTVDPTGRTVAVGFADGVLRVLERCVDGLSLSTVSKPHDSVCVFIQFVGCICTQK
jgi:WD40 repeat protein